LKNEKAGDGIRTHDVQLGKLEPYSVSDEKTNTYEGEPSATRLSPRNSNEIDPLDPALATVVKAWPELPEATRQAVLAVVRAAVGGGGDT